MRRNHDCSSRSIKLVNSITSSLQLHELVSFPIYFGIKMSSCANINLLWLLDNQPFRVDSVISTKPTAIQILDLLNLTFMQDQYTHVVELKGVRLRSQWAIDHLVAWDDYVARTVEFVDVGEKMRVKSSQAQLTSFNGMARILIGIFSNSFDPEEKKSLLKKGVKEHDCQMAYAFVFGANCSGPAMRVDSLSLPEMETSPFDENEPDAIYLDIRENMEDGKSDTWLKYASLLQNELYFDYVGKIDSDTILFPDTFFASMSSWPKFPQNVRIFGGKDEIKWEGVGGPIVGPAHMRGQFYWMSPDLARFISSKCNRTKLSVSIEDRNIGNCVNSHPFPVKRLRANPKAFFHPLKDTNAFHRVWQKHWSTLHHVS
ncbi:unnamed protein product [Cylindrotheca closterium]|uniref:Hexosyltransferase n=1 Tax=Cylindrotheca closterium TaxID=2856 RepID=A0AAD2CDN7_9STRA|nr:unnamed protein product [Cylindrotheca closterium]